MSQEFKSKYEQLRENSRGSLSSVENDNHQISSSSRNMCFVLKDGSIFFLNYGYLVSGNLNDEHDKILLSFTSHEITLEGQSLEPLFNQLVDHRPKFVKEVEDRYAGLEDKNQSMVFKISVVKNE